MYKSLEVVVTISYITAMLYFIFVYSWRFTLMKLRYALELLIIARTYYVYTNTTTTPSKCINFWQVCSLISPLNLPWIWPVYEKATGMNVNYFAPYLPTIPKPHGTLYRLITCSCSRDWPSILSLLRLKLFVYQSLSDSLEKCLVIDYSCPPPPLQVNA